MMFEARGIFNKLLGKYNGLKISHTRIRHLYLITKRKNYDVVVVGGGIVGTSSAREILLRHPNLKVAVLEKEKHLAAHQSGHNSGVIHAGIYYKPGTLKAKLCVEGLKLSYKYLDENEIPYKKCGKLIVATDESEIGRLRDLYKRGIANEVPDLKLISEDEIKNIEPFCEGVEALWSPHTGIVDWGRVTWHFGEDIKKAGGDIYLSFKVTEFIESTDNVDYPVTIRSEKPGKEIQAKYVLTCGGLQSDLLAEMTGCSRAPRIVPIRGEYLLLDLSKTHMVKGNIYPVPNPALPFLGVHFTPRMDGSVWLGPNAILAFKREGYSWWDINLFELFDALRYRGFLKLAAKNFRFGIQEMIKSAIIPFQVKDLQKYIPEILEYDISRGPSGVRAQALDMDGNLVDDFVFDRGTGDNVLSKRIIHCRNAPSPGATSSLAIAKMVVDKIEKEFNIK